MENFLRIYSIIIMCLSLISFIITAFFNKEQKLNKTAFFLILLYAPVFYYIIKF